MNTSIKTCFKCRQLLTLDNFYKHPQMADGHLNKCKDCARTDVSENRSKNCEYYRTYDRGRANLPHRVKARVEYTAGYRNQFPNRKKAMNELGNAIREGRVLPQPCWICGAKAHGHHPDYDAPLAVAWLCAIHHKQVHLESREAQS
jgi:hypothetical protein